MAGTIRGKARRHWDHAQESRFLMRRIHSEGPRAPNPAPYVGVAGTALLTGISFEGPRQSPSALGLSSRAPVASGAQAHFCCHPGSLSGGAGRLLGGIASSQVPAVICGTRSSRRLGLIPCRYNSSSAGALVRKHDARRKLRRKVPERAEGRRPRRHWAITRASCRPLVLSSPRDQRAGLEKAARMGASAAERVSATTGRRAGRHHHQSAEPSEHPQPVDTCEDVDACGRVCHKPPGLLSP